ncbi:MAG: hypothetical protein JNM69_21040 [Archangium sp.]|nr:hypothetical protein [Archangium sp.]
MTMSSRDVSEELKALMARNRGPDPAGSDARVQPDYGIEATLVDECVIRMRLTFKAGRHYCCPEVGDHLPRFAIVREALQLSEYVKIVFSLQVVVERGARFLSFSGSPNRFEAYRGSSIAFDYPEW